MFSSATRKTIVNSSRLKYQVPETESQAIAVPPCSNLAVPRLTPEGTGHKVFRKAQVNIANLGEAHETT
jgi:hypothetical protein